MHLLRELANLQLDTCTKWFQWTLKAGGRVCLSSYCNIATQRCRGHVTHHSNLTCRLLYLHTHRLPSKQFFGDFKSDKIWMHQKILSSRFTLYCYSSSMQFVYWHFESSHQCIQLSLHLTQNLELWYIGSAAGQWVRGANLNQNVSDLV